jgi:hypothetical protein
MGLQTQIFNASTGREINAAFAAIARERCDAVFIVGDPYFTVRRVQLANLAVRHAVPTAYVARDFPEARRRLRAMRWGTWRDVKCGIVRLDGPADERRRPRGSYPAY